MRKRRAISPQQTRFNRASLILLYRRVPYIKSPYVNTACVSLERYFWKISFRSIWASFLWAALVALIRPLVATLRISGKCLVPAPESFRQRALNASASFPVDKHHCPKKQNPHEFGPTTAPVRVFLISFFSCVGSFLNVYAINAKQMYHYSPLFSKPYNYFFIPPPKGLREG